ncbi:hypothetical protein [Clostridium botulinum]|uniref:hypothetical protein n=1 Tax=Clostridium botulinum TaxID=1491 RepID=UPI00077476A5|nr:hypothetical protein [Clostridium botulinum]NFA35159.1 hypothetical protein [Clostridium botulinum]
MEKKVNIDGIVSYLIEVEGYPILSFTDEEKQAIQDIMSVLSKKDVTVIRAKKILEFCITATNFSKIDK